VGRDRWIHGLTRDGGPEIHFVENGSGEPVLLLHGFPDFWYMWRYQIPYLAAKGFRVIALDLRGYNRSDAPRGVQSYAMEKLSGDVIRVMDALGILTAHMVGHDWGGVIAWHVAAHHPQRVRKLVVINAPHPAAYFRALARSSQLLRSWYLFAFQVPRLPEYFLSVGHFRLLKRVWARAGGESGNVSADNVGKYVKAFSKPGKLTAAVNYYRAALRSMLRRKKNGTVSVPTLLLWGEKDRFLVSALPELTSRYVPNLETRKLADFGHWPQLESPDTINAAISEFLAHDQAQVSTQSDRG
jgi:epoxide hydrolase 4